MWGLPSAPGVFAIGFDYARYLAWLAFLKLLSTVVGGASSLLQKLSQDKPRDSVSSDSDEGKIEQPSEEKEEESAFEEVDDVEEIAIDPLNLVLSDDILPEILKHLDAASLKSSRLVSRHWCQLATPILASKVAVHLYTVDKYTEYGVEPIPIEAPPCSFHLETSRHVNHFTNFLTWRDSKEEASDRRLIAYKHFKLTFASWLAQPLAIFPQNMRLFLLPRVQESLVSLTVQGRHLGWLRFALGNLPHLRSLKLECDWYHSEHEYAGIAAEDEFNSFNVELGHFSNLPQLTELSVVQNRYFDDGPPQWHWILAASPQLTSLNLSLAAEVDMFFALESLFRYYRGFGLQKLTCQFFESLGGYGCFVRETSRFALLLHQILNSDHISKNLKYFSCNVLLTPEEWARVFTPTTNRPQGSLLETLSISIFTSNSRDEFVNDFLLFCPTYSGAAYLRRLKSLSLCVVDTLVRKNSSAGIPGDEASTSSSSSETVQLLKSGRVLPQLRTLSFYYFSDVTPYQQLSEKFFQPFPNLKSLTTNVDTRKCVTAIFRHLPLGLKKLSLHCTLSEYMFPLEIEDFFVYLHKVQSIEELLLIMESSRVTDDAVLYVFTKFRNLKKLVFGSFPCQLTSLGWRLLRDAGIESQYMFNRRVYNINYSGAIMNTAPPEILRSRVL